MPGQFIDLGTIGSRLQRVASTQGAGYVKLPGAYVAQAITEFTFPVSVTASVANKIYNIALNIFGDPAGAGTNIVDGTNQVCVYEVIVTQNGFTPATGSNAGLKVYFYRENTADGQAPTTTAFAACALDASQIDTPTQPPWSVLKLAFAATATGTYQFQVRGLYYTP